jgi:putative hydrolase of the HAD superfamily
MPLLLCDLDDTLVNRDEAFRVWATTFAELHSLPEPETVAWLTALDGHGYCPRSQLVAAIIERYAVWPDEKAALRQFCDDLVRCLPRVSAESATLLTSLRKSGWQVGIVTNGETHHQEDKVKASGLTGLIDVCIVSEAVGCWKPDPTIFRIAAERCGTDLVGGWMFGDHPEADIRGASDIGLSTIWLRRGQQWDLPGGRPTAEVDSPEEGLRYLVQQAGS